ncbi:hypothetical protein HGB07_03725 [Candidatus Roizmanbacteria bacterium]|nr:hypothetical protein [Candidatus Roizmanbacteria bacterium]
MQKRNFTGIEKAVEELEPTDTHELVVLTKEDVLLVDSTIEEIKNIFDNKLTDIYIKIGTLIIKKIYNNDVNAIDFSKGPKKKDASKWAIFKSLTEEIDKRSEQGEELPKKTFLYNAVRLVQDQKKLAGSPEYAKISISHKIALLPIDDSEEKIKLAKQISAEKLSVRKLRDLIFGKDDQKEKSLLDFIKNPDEIENIAVFLDSKLESLVANNKIRKSAISKCSKRKDEIKKEVASMNVQIEKLEALASRLELTEPKTNKKK